MANSPHGLLALPFCLVYDPLAAIFLSSHVCLCHTNCILPRVTLSSPSLLVITSVAHLSLSLSGSVSAIHYL